MDDGGEVGSGGGTPGWWCVRGGDAWWGHLVDTVDWKGDTQTGRVEVVSDSDPIRNWITRPRMRKIDWPQVDLSVNAAVNSGAEGQRSLFIKNIKISRETTGNYPPFSQHCHCPESGCMGRPLSPIRCNSLVAPLALFLHYVAYSRDPIRISYRTLAQRFISVARIDSTSSTLDSPSSPRIVTLHSPDPGMRSYIS